jgi:hypothetical protein
LFVGRALAQQWTRFRGQPVAVNPHWIIIGASMLVVLATYAVLIDTWRRMVRAWEQEGRRRGQENRPGDFSFLRATGIWTIANLGKYVPGKVWQIGAMATLAERAGVSPMAAAGSSILNQIVNIATGILVALVAGWRSLSTLSGGYAGVGVGVALIALTGVLLLPSMLPVMLDTARRVTGRPLTMSVVPRRAVYISIVGNVLSWLMYGVAFELFVYGVTGTHSGAFSDYVTAWAWPYIIGYLAVFAPGGIGVRESALAVALGALRLATPQTALVIAITSRLWLTVTELLPGFTFLALGWTRRPPTSRLGNGP